MHSRRLVKRSILGSRVYAPSPAGDGAVITGVVQAVKQENKDASTGPRRNVYTVLMQDGSLNEYSEDEIAVGSAQMIAKGPLKSSLKVGGIDVLLCFLFGAEPLRDWCLVLHYFAAVILLQPTHRSHSLSELGYRLMNMNL